LELRIKNIDFGINKVDASEMHKGNTKSSWISFFTQQTSDNLENHLITDEFQADDSDYDNSRLFTVSDRYVQQAFKDASDALGISVNPHLLRTVFAEKCTQAKLADKYIDAFCGRIPQSVLSKHYTDYSPQALRKQYDKVEPFLTLKTQL
jgi:site-specific recombinase XerC